MRSLGTLSGFERCHPEAINAKGQVLGYCTSENPYRQHAFLWHRGGMRDLGDLTATALNDVGQLAGTMRVNGRTHAFLWQDGKLQDLGNLGGRHAFVTGLNNGGEVIGSSYTDGGRLHAFALTGRPISAPAVLSTEEWSEEIAGLKRLRPANAGRSVL
jgi:probable HAF family extracellular repeat protein